MTALSVRLYLAGFALMWLVVSALVDFDKRLVADVSAKFLPALVVFAVLMLPEGVRGMALILRSRFVRICCIVLLACMGYWFWEGYDFSTSYFLFWLGLLWAFPGLIAWFSKVGDAGFRWVLLAKILTFLFAVTWIGGAIFQHDLASDVLRDLPVYRHIRHFNYDLALVFGLALGGVFYARRTGFWLTAALFVILGYFSFWSMGRGQLLANIVMLAIMGSLIVIKKSGDDFGWMTRRVSAYLGCFAGGAALLLAFGQTDLFLHGIERSSQANLARISSGRLPIWGATFEYLFSNGLGTLLFGLGPDSYSKIRGGWALWAIAQPHNTIVQWVFDYGLLGGTAVLAMYWEVTKRVLMPLVFGVNDFCRLVAITVSGMSVFALVDGIYYHPEPLVFMVIIWAFLFSKVIDPLKLSPR